MDRISNSERHKKGLGVKGKLGLTAAAAGTVAVGLFGADQGAQPVSADDSTATATATRTATSTPTSTPDAKEQQIAALSTAVAKAAKEHEQDQQIANLQATATALKETPTRTVTPPTATQLPVDATTTAEARRLDALGKKQAEIKATATAEAGLTATPEARMTATAEARQTPTTSVPTGSGGTQEGGIPIVPMAGAAAVVGAVGWANRRRIEDAGRMGVNIVRNPVTRTRAADLVRRTVTAIRTKLHI